ncbi:ABC transporter permease [Xanthobacter aminoxidans]|uniref:ABC transporter permease n=1 Tax=Xanthobacter aminoxidans TaxID=186280 RepID=UPI002022D752|nr:ABC transporter permease [Xanthobacter aminoxidans]MCL8382355.1 ABC transporter permease [Xanthobacter aminoxidans]
MAQSDAPLTRFAGESWNTAFSMHARVVGAVIMRDMQTRFGASYAGFLLGLIMPLGHLGIAIGILSLIGRVPPVGQGSVPFLLTGVLPFVVWFYCHRQIMICFAQNKPLLYFPGVDVFDILVARTITEIASGTLVIVTLLFAVAAIGYDVTPHDIINFSYGLILTWSFGIATGIIFGATGVLWPPMIMAGSLLTPLFWISSGILYLPEAMPDRIQMILNFLPLCQIVEGIRTSFFSEYQSSFYNPHILYISIIFLLAVGIMFIGFVRKIG